MYLTRRKLIKAHLSVGSLAYRLIPATGASSEPLYGINAYYLMIESYRKAQENLMLMLANNYQISPR